MNFVITAIAVGIGAFFAISPVKAASIWGRTDLDALGATRRAVYLWSFRAMGIALGLAGVLVAVDGMYH